MKITCKNCGEETNIRAEYIINEKTVCPECKELITTEGDLIDMDAFVDLPLDERNRLTKVIRFRSNKASQFQSMEKFEKEIEDYLEGLLISFPSIDFESLGVEVTDFLIENHKDLSKGEIIMFKKCVALIAAVVRIQTQLKKLDSMTPSEIIEIIERNRDKLG